MRHQRGRLFHDDSINRKYFLLMATECAMTDVNLELGFSSSRFAELHSQK